MKIAFFADCFFPQLNGVVTATLMLAEELHKRGHEVHVLAPSYRNYKGDSQFPFVVKRFASFNARFYDDFKWVFNPNPSLLRYFRKHNFDILHFQAPMSMAAQAIFIAKVYKKPLIGTFHTFFADPEYLKHAKLNYPIVEKFGWYYSNKHYNRCDVVTVPSKQTGIELKNNKCTAPIRYISNGINLKQFDNTKAAEFRKKWNFSEKDIVFLFVGRIAHEKNILSLIKVFSHIGEKNKAIKLLIVGGGPQKDTYASYVKEHSLQNNIQFTGSINHDDLVVSGVFGACDYFITLSKTENQPITILEAQANGLIPFCYAEKGLKTMIEHGKTGWFLENKDENLCGDELLSIISNTEQINNLKETMLAYIQSQSIENIAVEWENLMQELIEQKKQKKSLKVKKKKLSRK